jgi:hypothetical protein
VIWNVQYTLSEKEPLTNQICIVNPVYGSALLDPLFKGPDRTSIQILPRDRSQTGPYLNVNQRPKLDQTDGFI